MNTEDTLPTVESEDGQTLTVHPVTGEAIDLQLASPEELVQLRDAVTDYYSKLNALSDAVRDELVRRVDRTGGRTAWIGNVKLETNAPTSESYDREALEAALEQLVADDVLDREAVDRVIVQPPQPPLPAKRVDRRAVNTLKKHPSPDVLAAIASARQVTPQGRTIKVLEVAVEAS